MSAGGPLRKLSQFGASLRGASLTWCAAPQPHSAADLGSTPKGEVYFDSLSRFQEADEDVASDGESSVVGSISGPGQPLWHQPEQHLGEPVPGEVQSEKDSLEALLAGMRNHAPPPPPLAVGDELSVAPAISSYRALYKAKSPSAGGSSVETSTPAKAEPPGSGSERTAIDPLDPRESTASGRVEPEHRPEQAVPEPPPLAAGFGGGPGQKPPPRPLCPSKDFSVANNPLANDPRGVQAPPFSSSQETPANNPLASRIQLGSSGSSRLTGFKEAWSSPSSAGSKPAKEMFWAELASAQQVAVVALGWSQLSWDDQHLGPFQEHSWSQLTATQHQAAGLLGFSRANWDEASEASVNLSVSRKGRHCSSPALQGPAARPQNLADRAEQSAPSPVTDDWLSQSQSTTKPAAALNQASRLDARAIGAGLGAGLGAKGLGAKGLGAKGLGAKGARPAVGSCVSPSALAAEATPPRAEPAPRSNPRQLQTQWDPPSPVDFTRLPPSTTLELAAGDGPSPPTDQDSELDLQLHQIFRWVVRSYWLVRWHVLPLKRCVPVRSPGRWMGKALG